MDWLQHEIAFKLRKNLDNPIDSSPPDHHSLPEQKAELQNALSGILYNTTVDGRNPAPLNMWVIPLFTWFYRSLVVQDFLHQL